MLVLNSSLRLLNSLFLFYVYEYLVYVYVSVPHAWLMRAWELSYVLGITWPSAKGQVFLTTEPFLHVSFP